VTSLIVFWILGTISIVGAIGVVLDRNVVRASLMLLVALLGVAGVFLVAFAEFLALAQILVYGGAVTIVVLFAIMLTRTTELTARLDNPHRPLAAIAAIAVFVLLTLTFIASDVPEAGGPASVGTVDSTSPTVGFEAVGESLFTQWAIPFEVASLILLVAMVGAIALARDREGAEKADSSLGGEGEHA
jgi:NADH:ubiquinone oxidoreductase subunit 6 (subunit J)